VDSSGGGGEGGKGREMGGGCRGRVGGRRGVVGGGRGELEVEGGRKRRWGDRGGSAGRIEKVVGGGGGGGTSGKKRLRRECGSEGKMDGGESG